MKNTKVLNEGIITVPYTIVSHSDQYTPSETYSKFMAQYKIDHEVCPECRKREYRSTLMCFVFYSDDPDSYQDQNDVSCNCGWKGIVHDLVKK